jgi:hypothetical protein
MPGHGAPEDGHEDHVDACVCDIELDDDEVTSDADLPGATGGVIVAQGSSINLENIDGCDLDFNEADPTTDDELTAAAGEVA